MRKLYGSTSWRRVLALVLVFVMMFSMMGTSGYSVFAEDDLPEVTEELAAPEPEAVDQEVTEDIQGPSPGEEEAPAEAAEAVEAVEAAEDEAEELAAEAEAVEEAEEPAEDAAPAEDEFEEPAEEAEEAEEPAEDAEPAEEAEEAVEEGEEAALEEEAEEAALEEGEEAEAEEPAEEPEEETAEEAEPAEEETLIAEAAQVIMNDDGSEAPAEEAEEIAEEAAEEAASSVVEEFVKGIEAEPAEEAEEAPAEPAEEPEIEAAEEAVEEIPEEVAEEPEIAYPAMGFRDIIGGISVTVDAPEGAFPEGTEMKLAEVEIETIIDAVADAVEGEIAKIKAVDITFFYEGEEIQPLLPINVVMNASGMTADSERQVLHIDDEGEATVVEDADTSRKAVEFEADSFSVYVIVATEDLRYTVTFMDGKGTEIAHMIIKKEDSASDVDTIIYDPGAGDVPEDQVFKGWATTATYTKDNLKTIEQVRSDAMTAVAALTTESPDSAKSITYYAALFTPFTITYQSDDETPISVGSDTVEIPSYLEGGENAYSAYTVNKGYTVDDKHNFEGWMVLDPADQAHVKSSTGEPYPAGTTHEVLVDGSDIYYYTNGTEVRISGDVTFTVRCPEGTWLVYNENGKAATYTAPQFVLKGNSTVKPDTLNRMTRNGYTFGGWYYGVYRDAVDEDGNPVKELVKDSKGYADLTDATPFTFEQPLPENTTIYAKWIPNETASYMIIFWTQNLDVTAEKKGYEVADSYSTTGNVGDNIDFTVVDNGDEDYVTGFGERGHYTGFCLTDASKNQQVEITPEGDAVLNLYYDRILYNFKFYLYRAGTQTDRYDYANNSGTGSSLNDLVTWHSNQTEHPDALGYSIGSEVVSGRTYYYFTMPAYYGQDLTDTWPTYDKITGANNRDPVSYVMMVGTKLKPTATSSGSGTVKGTISVMNENILGKTNDANGNYVVVRFPDNFYHWRYHIWFETVEGEDYTDKTTHVYNGKTYYEEEVMEVRSSNTTDGNQNEPKYTGFDYVTRVGQNQQGVWQGGHWTTTDNGTTLYHLNYIYDRQEFTVNFFDGEYVDGDGKQIQNRASHPLNTSALIPMGAVISDDVKNYKPDAPEPGFVFEGWYLDEGCQSPYPWDKMTYGGINVYAKWRQIQYRAFLHSNVPVGDPLTWGSENQALSFRISYGGKVSTPTGVRDGYKFLGWYTDSTFDHAFNADAFVLNESTVTEDYDKTTTVTDPENRPWEIDSDNPDAYNSDLIGWDDDGDPNTPGKERYWISKKLDLYANWSKVLEGAEGIGVVYDAADGSNAPTDPGLYLDNVKVTASAASTAPTDQVFDHWVVGTWDADKGEYAYDLTDEDRQVLPGETFLIKSDDARKEADGAGTDGKPKYKYTVSLQAVYVTPEEKTPTHIDWYPNYGTANNGAGEAYRHDTFAADGETEILAINEGVPIYGLGDGEQTPARQGYKFLGWTKKKGGTSADFLVWTGSGYTSNGKDAAQVAADEQTPIEAVYAVWEAIDVDYTVEFYYQDAPESTSYTMDPNPAETRQAKTDSPVAVTDTDKAQTKDGKYVLVTGTPSVLSADAVAGDNSTVLKLYFDLAKVDVTVEHYLLGEAKAFKTDTIEDQTVTSEYTATPETAYQGKTLTVKSYDPSQTITVAVESATTATTNLIKIYYTLPLTITAKTDSKTYDSKPLTGEYTVTGALEGDAAAIKDALGDAPSITNVGSLEYPNANEQGTIAADIPEYYVVTWETGTLTVEPAKVIVTADNQGKIYGDPDPDLTATVSGTIGQDTVAYKVGRAIGEDVGEYTITPTGDKEQGNYIVEYKTGVLKITGDGLLTVEKKSSPAPESGKFALGDVITYTITVKNDGTLPINNITVTDAKLGKTWTIQSLAPKADPVVYEVEYTVTEQDILNGSVVNDATATGELPGGGEPEVVPGHTEDPTEPKNPHLTVVKETTNKPGNNQPYAVGDTIEYKITVTNDGNVTISGVKVTDELTGDEWTVNDPLAPGKSATFTTTYTVTAADSKATAEESKVINEATATGKDPKNDDPEVVPGKTEDPVEPTVPPVAKQYTILYNSNYTTYGGEEDKTGSDGPAESLTILSPDNTKLGFAEKDGEDLIWKLGDKTFKFVGWTTARKGGNAYEVGDAFPKAEGSAVQAASSSIRSGLRMAGSSSDETKDDYDLTLYAQWEYIHLKVTKETTSTPKNGTYYEKDEVIEYTITVENDGTVDIKDIEIVDKLEGVEPAEGESMKIDVLKAGESKTVKVTYKVTDKDVDAGKVVNEATAKATIPGTEDEVPAEPGTKEVPTGKPEVTPTPREREPREEVEPIEEPETPLAPVEEEPEEPIDDGDTPYAGYEEEPDEEVAEEPTPFSPYTGDDRHTVVWSVISLLSLAGIAVVARKRREEE